jgi:hypothetical protein
MKSVALWITLALLAASTAPAQSVDTLGLEDYRAIYRAMEPNTEMFVKDEWTITDPQVISEVLFRLVNYQGIGSSDLSIFREHTADFVRKNDAGLLSIKCRKRWSSSDIERMTFIDAHADSVPLATLTDFAYISTVLMPATYAKVSRNPLNRFSSPQGLLYDLYFHAENPEFLFWSTQPDSSKYYKLSFFGRLGNDNLDLPFWFKGTMVVGLHLGYVDNISMLSKDRDYSLYGLYLGLETPINFAMSGKPSSSGGSIFKSRLVEGSGNSVFFRATYTPWSKLNIITNNFEEQVQFLMEVSVALQEKRVYPATIPDQFYSVRNYLTLAGYLKHAGLFNFGAGLSIHDSHWLTRYNPSDQPVVHLAPSTNNVLPFLEAGISQDGGLLQYAFTTQVNYNLSEKYGFFVFKSYLSLSNTFGVDVRYFKSFNSNNLPPWHYGNYLEVSPVVRINF